MINWLELEDRIRRILKRYRDQELDPYEALYAIDAILGEETGRGWELKEEKKGGEQL